MATAFPSRSVIHFHLLLFVFLSFSNAAQTYPYFSARPSGIVFDLHRDPSTLQFWIQVNQGTPLAGVKLVLDLGGKSTWNFCRSSSSIRPVKCMSPLCSQGNKPDTSRCINKNGCSVQTSNPVTGSVGKNELMSDLVAVTPNPDSFGIPVPSPGRFSFSCATASNSLTGLAKGAKGVAGLGRSSILSLATQFAVEFRLPRIFAIELYGGNNTRLYFGGGPYFHYDISDESVLSRYVMYTPLLINPKRREEYFVDLKSIVVHGITVPIDAKLLSIDTATGTGGTKVDIQTPYTTLETSIYNALVKVYNEWAVSMNITRVAAVAPFTACYNSSTVPWYFDSRLPTTPPRLTFVFPESRWNIAWWDLYKVNDVAHCVQFLDGGPKPMTSIVIGARQIELAEIDLVRSQFGFVKPNFWEPDS